MPLGFDHIRHWTCTEYNEAYHAMERETVSEPTKRRVRMLFNSSSSDSLSLSWLLRWALTAPTHQHEVLSQSNYRLT